MYEASKDRYQEMKYRRCGRSGLLLPEVSFGLWQNFGLEKTLEEQKEILFTAFDAGVTHFDLANNYGHPANGMAEENFGRVLREEFKPYRDEMVISTKAGYDMWEGPYGNWGSRKYLIASLDQSLKRMGLDYVDIFYHHRPDPETPLEETMGALSDIVRQGKALYAGISNYGPEETEKAVEILRRNGTPCLIHQVRYNMFERAPEEGLFSVLRKEGVGCICFSPLAQGALTGKYLKGISSGTRAAKAGSTLKERYLSPEKLHIVEQLSEVAEERGQTMAQLALSWVLRRREVTSVLVGASRPEQLKENLAVISASPITEDEEIRITGILEGTWENI